PGTIGRLVRLPDDFERVLRYYERFAPDKLPAPTPWPAADATSFVRRGLNPISAPSDPAVANVRLVDLRGDGRLDVTVADMRYGLVMIGRPYSDDAELKVIAQLDYPCHVSTVDFDKDGIPDFLIADLGQFLPGDQKQGSVVLLRGTANGRY